ncbi:MAG: hypothetical protein AAGD23_11170 [Pseudomonadota bacterium]
MQRAQRRWHARIWLIMGFGLPVLFLALMAMRQTTPLERPAVLVEPPEASSAAGTGENGEVTQ